MKAISDYLDEAKKISGSDYKTAKILGISRQALSSMRSRGTISTEKAMKLGIFLGCDPLKIIVTSAANKKGSNKDLCGQWVDNHNDHGSYAMSGKDSNN